jgi:peptide chain release factor 1
MKIPKKDLRIETMRGTGPGGQHRNKTDSACRITHLPTGISAYADERSQSVSKRKALQELQVRLKNRHLEHRATQRKERRDWAIHNTETIRTYDFSRGLVTDLRSCRTATIKNILGKGKLELLR